MSRRVSQDPSGSAAERVVALFRDGAQAAREMIVENESLRRRLAELERAAGADAAAARARALEQELHQLTNLYVASRQLHASLHLPEVLAAITEILVDLVGVDAFAIYVLDERSHALEVVAASGLEPAALAPTRLGRGFVGEALEQGAMRIAPDGSPGGVPLAVVPLCVKDRPVGAIAVHRLLPHKAHLTRFDAALFELLAGHAATALCAARAYAESERKLQTVRGFLALLGRTPEEAP